MDGWETLQTMLAVTLVGSHVLLALHTLRRAVRVKKFDARWAHGHKLPEAGFLPSWRARLNASHCSG